MEQIIRAAGRLPRQRTTLYGPVPPERVFASFEAAPIEPKVNTRLRRKHEAAGPVWAPQAMRPVRSIAKETST
jgi:FO synthase